MVSEYQKGEAINAFRIPNAKMFLPIPRPDESFHLEIRLDKEEPKHLEELCGCKKKAWDMAWVKRRPVAGSEAIKAVLEAVRALDKGGKGADYVEVRERVKWIEAKEFDDAIDALMDRGQIYEPVLGRLRII